MSDEKINNAKWVSLIGYLLLVVPLLFLIYTYSIIGNNVISILFQIGTVALMIWARITFGLRSFHPMANPTKGGLITTGPYHYIRHPIYTSVLVFIWSGILTHLSILNLLMGVCAIAAVIIRVITEEHLIVSLYPEYSEYAKKTKRFIPYIL